MHTGQRSQRRKRRKRRRKSYNYANLAVEVASIVESEGYRPVSAMAKVARKNRIKGRREKRTLMSKYYSLQLT